MNGRIREKLNQLPHKAGVYIMHDAAGEVIYVGKAKILPNRVKQYFTGTHTGKVAAMVSQVDDFEYILCDNEMEALVLECNLIKRYSPYYNILLKDDKHYPYVRIDDKSDFPVVEIVRSVKHDGARYFGPYVAAYVIRDVIKSIYVTYPLRTCRKDISRAIKRKERPCLNYQMGKCYAPCAGKISREEYRKLVSEVEQMLGQGQARLKKKLTDEMYRASEDRRYEQAAQLRDKIKLISRIEDRQKAGFPNLEDRDVFGAAIGSDRTVIQAFLVRDGNLSFAEKFTLSPAESEAEALAGFITQYYTTGISVPSVIHVSHEIEDSQLIEKMLSDMKGRRVSIICPKIGDNRKLADLACSNAGDAVRLKENDEKRRLSGLDELKSALGLKNTPHRIECYDISNTQGTDSVASMVVMIDGKPEKKLYRKFRIKTVEGANDFASMSEVLERRLLRTLGGSEQFPDMPDLIIVDGGKGQLSAAYDVLASLGLENSIDICGLAKKEEELFVPGISESVKLARRSMPLRLVTNLRDEAHRFAITYHRNLREKRQTKSILDSVPGVGEQRKKALLKRFGGIEGIRCASADEIASVPGISHALAEEISDRLRPRV